MGEIHMELMTQYLGTQLHLLYLVFSVMVIVGIGLKSRPSSLPSFCSWYCAYICRTFCYTSHVIFSLNILAATLETSVALA